MSDPINSERLAEIREALAAITTHRPPPKAYADRERARDRWTLRSSDYAAELLAEVDRLTAELAKARADQQWLAALEAAGVDNWVGYDMARKMHREHELKTGAHTYAVDVFYMDNNHWFGPDGWTWCPVIDGEPEDNTSDLPHCADEADARAKAAAWLASKTGGPTRD